MYGSLYILDMAQLNLTI